MVFLCVSLASCMSIPKFEEITIIQHAQVRICDLLKSDNVFIIFSEQSIELIVVSLFVIDHHFVDEFSHWKHHIELHCP